MCQESATPLFPCETADERAGLDRLRAAAGRNPKAPAPAREIFGIASAERVPAWCYGRLQTWQAAGGVRVLSRLGAVVTTPGLEVLGLRVPDLTFVVCPSCRAEVPGERLRCDSEPCDRPQVRVKCACGEAYRIEPFHPAKTALPYDAQRLLCPRCGQRNLPVGFEDWYRARASMLGFAGFELERIDWVVVGQDPFTDPDRRIPLPGGAEADYPRWTEAYVPIPWRQAEARTPSP